MIVNKSVILISSLFHGGAEKCVSTFLGSLSELELESIDLILLYDNIFFEIPDKLNVIVLSNRKPPSNFLIKILDLIVFSFKLFRLSRKHKYKIVQSYLFYCNYINLFSRIWGAPHSVQVFNRSSISRYYTDKFADKLKLFLLKSLYRNADLILSNSLGVSFEIGKVVKNVELKVIHNIFDILLVEKKSLEEVSYSFDDDKEYIVIVARLINLKRHIDLFNAIKTLESKHKDIHVLCLGDGECKSFLMNEVVRLDLTEKITFLGAIKNPYPFFRRASIAVLCSEVEGFPNVLVEALINNCAVVSSNCKHGPAEILEDGKYGLLYSVGNIEELVGHLSELLTNRFLADKYQNIGKLRAKDFDISIIKPSLLRVLDI
ncbi:glycosyltransferase [bacterium]|jgi:glycosyltransferase involved in cell wall biosynthesis|nr:glycosyltransferase [bacterium]